MDQRQTNWQVIQLTRASLTEDDARRRTSEGEAGRQQASNQDPRHGYVRHPPARQPHERGTVLLIRQIEADCGLAATVLIVLAWLAASPK